MNYTVEYKTTLIQCVISRNSLKKNFCTNIFMSNVHGVMNFCSNIFMSNVNGVMKLIHADNLSISPVACS